MKRPELIIILLTVLLLAFPSSLFAYETIRISGRLDARIRSGIDKVQKGEYDEALETFQQIIKRHPESPVGYFYTAALYEVLMQNFRNRIFAEKFDFYINKAIQKGEERLGENKKDAWLYFYLGGSYGYRAIDRSETGHWFGAFSDALKGADYLDRAIKLNPELYDAYYGFGVYKYWRSVKSKILWFLPFVNDERESGIKDIYLAISKGRYSKYQALGTLIGIYQNEKKYEKALGVAESILEAYPENLYALKMKAILYADLEKWDEAASAFSIISKKLEHHKWQSATSELELNYYVTLIEFQEQKLESCVLGCLKLIKAKDEVKDYARSDTFIELREKIDKLCRVDVLCEIEKKTIKHLAPGH